MWSKKVFVSDHILSLFSFHNTVLYIFPIHDNIKVILQSSCAGDITATDFLHCMTLVQCVVFGTKC